MSKDGSQTGQLFNSRPLILALFTTLACLSLLIYQPVRVRSDALRQIDQLVYQYYEWTEGEIRMVEGGV